MHRSSHPLKRAALDLSGRKARHSSDWSRPSFHQEAQPERGRQGRAVLVWTFLWFSVHGGDFSAKVTQTFWQPSSEQAPRSPHPGNQSPGLCSGNGAHNPGRGCSGLNKDEPAPHVSVAHRHTAPGRDWWGEGAWNVAMGGLGSHPGRTTS